MNDLNILEVILHFSSMLSGQFPPATPRYSISSTEMNWYYYITDGIYPPWKIFVKALSDTDDEKILLFNRNVVVVRKCIERVFGVLYRRFKLLFIYFLRILDSVQNEKDN